MNPCFAWLVNYIKWYNEKYGDAAGIDKGMAWKFRFHLKLQEIITFYRLLE